MTERDLFLVYDTEANHFYEKGTKMWCLCAKDMLTKQRWEWGGPEGLEPHREEIRALFRRAKILVCHNQIKHDLPQMYKLGIVSPQDWWDAKIIDTWTISPDYKGDLASCVGVTDYDTESMDGSVT